MKLKFLLPMALAVLVIALVARHGPQGAASASSALSAGGSSDESEPAQTPKTAAAAFAHASTSSAIPRPILAFRGAVKGLPLGPRSVASGGAPRKGRVVAVQAPSPSALAALSVGDLVALPLPDGSIRRGVVNVVRHDENRWVRVGGSLDENGSFAFSANGKDAGGLIQFPGSHVAYELRRERDGQILLVERPLGEVRCDTIPRPKFEPPESALPSEPQAAPPLISSRPNATAVLYLDFDGAVVTDPLWNNGNTINAPAARLSDSQIVEVLNRVKEDFFAFNVDVTNDVTRYNTAAVGRRMRCIITRNDAAAPGAGGVAYIRSFDRAGTGSFTNNIPCWTFIDNQVKACADATAHELGHALGLQHDGRTQPVEEYYEGHGSGATGWAPIMGVGYSQALVHWSKGEYNRANQKQDDIAIISDAANGFGFVSDEAGGTTASAALLDAPGGTINQGGVITQASDIDVFRFSTGGGTVTISAAPATIDPNVDLLLELLNSAGTAIATDNPTNGLNASVSQAVAAGTYYVRVRGTGKGDPLTTGYTSYGSMGAYQLTGTIPAMASVPAITSAGSANGTVGTLFSFQIAASNGPTTFGVTGTLPTGVNINGSGLISGTPTQAGTFNVTVTAANAQGTGSKALQILIMPAVLSLAEAVDQTGRTFTLGGNGNWFAQNVTTFDGVDAARSGAIGDLQSSFFETTINGPATVSFRWSVSSEATYDFLRVAIDGVEQAAISGDVSFETRTFAIASGAHVMRWSYTKDEFVSEGADAGFVDVLTVTPLQKPTITSGLAVAGTVGQPLTYQITGTNIPNAFGVTGTLPAGVSINPGTGLISGTPTASGTFSVTIGASNSAGTGTALLAINIAAGGITLTEALDAPGLVFLTGGNQPWAGQNLVTFDGADAARSGTITANQESRFESTISGPATLSFRWRVDSEEGFDYLRVFVDNFDAGQQLAQISGPVDWTLQTVTIGPGEHTVRWTYTKDEALDVGADAGWIDALTVSTESVPVVTSAPGVNGEVGVPFAYQVIASGNPASFAFSGTLPPGLSFNSSSGRVSGEPTNAGTFVFSVTASNNAGTSDPLEVTATVTASALTLATALDAPGLVWTTAGDLPWIAQTQVTHDRFDAAQVHGLGDNQQSSLSTTITGPVGVRFFWKVDSEAGFDFVVFLVDGVERERISGDRDWSRRSLPLGPGTHTITWRYEKDATVSGGVDKAWVDQVQVVPLDEATGRDDFADASPLDGTLVVTQGDNSGTTTETGEPLHAGVSNASSLWWEWTAPKTGKVTISTAGSAIDTALAVYTGDTLATLTPVASNDNSRRTQQSMVRFSAIAGEVYKIAVAGTTTGTVKLLITYLGSSTYTGVLRAPRADAPAGIIAFRLNERLSFTSFFTLGAQRVSFRSSVTSDPQTFNLVFINSSGGFATTVVTADSIGTDRIEGTLDFGGDTYAFTAVASLAARDAPPALPGAFTFLTAPRAQGASIPGGIGYGRISLSRKAMIRASGVLGDGRKFSAAGPLTVDHSWTLFAKERDGGGIAGDVFFDAGGQTLQGLLRWVKPPNQSRYPDAFSLTSDLFGSRYVRPTRVDPIFTFRNATVRFASNAGLDVPSGKTLTVSETGRVTIAPGAGISLSISGRTGFFRGRTIEPASGAPASFGGAVLLIYDYAAGTVLLPDGTGAVLLQENVP